MASSSYDATLTRLLVHEGGYTNHPADSGRLISASLGNAQCELLLSVPERRRDFAVTAPKIVAVADSIARAKAPPASV